MRKILFLIPVSFAITGGMEKYNHLLSTYLGKRLGKKNILVIPVWDSLWVTSPMDPEDLNYTIINFKFLFGLFEKGILKKRKLNSRVFNHSIRLFCSYWILRRGVDCIFCGHINLSEYCYQLSKIFHIPYVVFTHGIEVWKELAVGKAESLSKAHLVVTVSNFTKYKLVEKGVPESKIYMLTNYVNVEEFHNKINCDEIKERHNLWDKKVLVTVGRMSAEEQYKGHDVVLNALPKILQKIPNVVFLIVGSGNDKEKLKKISRRLAIENKVIFAGFVPAIDLPKYYNAADIFVMLSKVEKRGNKWVGEGFGIVYIEASACGKPVIAGRAGGATDAVEDGVSGLLVDPTDVDEIAETVIKLLADEQYARKLGEQGRMRVEKQFSYNVLEKRIDELIKRIEDLQKK